MKNFAKNNKLKKTLTLCLLCLSALGCLSPKIEIAEPRKIAWGQRGDKGYSEEVIGTYNWICADSDTYIVREK